MKAISNNGSRIVLIIILLAGNSLVLQAQQLALQWSQKFGQAGWDYVNDIAVTGNGNYILGGSLKGNLPDDTTNINTLQSSNAWIASCDTNGNIQWQKTFGGSGFENVTSIVKIPEGILLAGIFQDSIVFDSLVLISPAYTSAYTALINENGEPFWIKRIGDNATISNFLLTSNDAGTCYIAGCFNDSLVLSGIPQSNNGESGLFLSQLQPDGNETNSIVFKGTGKTLLGGLSCNDSLICIAGSFSDTLRFADTLIVSLGEMDAFIALYNHSGQLKWVRTTEGLGTENISDIVIAKNGEIGITGSFNYTTLLGQSILETQGAKDILLMVINPNGSIKWSKSIGGLSNDYGYTIQVNELNDFYVSGSFVHIIGIPDENGIIIELESFSPFGNAFIAKYNKDGILIASYNLPGTSEDFCQKLIVNERGVITATGNFYGNMLLLGSNGQTTELISSGEKDIFLLRFEDICKDFLINAGPDTLLCPGQSISLIPVDSYTSFQWTPGGKENRDLEVTNPGIYTLTATNLYGCVASDSLVVEMAALPIVNAGNDTIVEPGSILYLDKAFGSEFDELVWTTNGEGYFGNYHELITNYSFANSDISSGFVFLSLTATNMCTSVTDSLTVTIPLDDDGVTAFPNPTSGPVTLVCEEGITIVSATITMQSGYIIQAGIPVNNPCFYYNLSNYPPGTYLFYLTINNGMATKVINKL